MFNVKQLPYGLKYGCAGARANCFFIPSEKQMLIKGRGKKTKRQDMQTVHFSSKQSSDIQIGFSFFYILLP